MNEILDMLSRKCGKYEGMGVNDENQRFYGELDLDCIVENSAILINFKAIGEDKKLYHEEHSLIAMNHAKELYLYSLSSNVLYMIPLEFRRHEQIDYARSSITFGYGLASDVYSYRQEISILLWYNGDIEYIYRWGVPGGSFKLRSKIRMVKSNSSKW